jgi:predicted phage tail component-like protein
MIGSFNFNSVESSSFDLVCKSVKRPLLPAVKTNMIELLGASGAYDFGDNEYSLRTITMRISYMGTSYEELRTRARDIAAWLSTSTWAQLIINDEPDKYYLAKVTSDIDLESLWELGSADIVFDCQPFAYSVTESSFTFTNIVDAYSCEFENLGTRVINFKSPQSSKSLITITGSWTTLSLSMNGNTLGYTISGNNAVLIIDNIEMTVTKNAVNAFTHLTGDIDDFLEIISGDNTLAVSGTGLNLSLQIDFISLWM